MRKVLLGMLMLVAFVAKAQVYNNEWIDYSKTYYKFRVGKDGLYRITGATLSSAGLASATADQFQLWRNGVQVPVYTSVSSGTLGASDYIEFWGKMNDGKPDKELYRDPSYQLNDKWSLISDSATYFLTANPAGAHLRLQPTANDVAGNSLPVEPYFLYTKGQYFKDKINSGYFFDVSGEHLYSSSYDINEGWTSADIQTTISLNQTPGYGTLTSNYFSNLYPASAGPAPLINASVGGNATHPSRRYRITLNGDSVLGGAVPYLNSSTDQATFNLSQLSSGNAALAVTNLSDPCTIAPCINIDRLVVHKIEMTYPRQFNFGGEVNFEFNLPASAAGNYLEISNFSGGGTAPVLYDLTNGKRYVGEISGSLVKFALQSSAVTRSLVLVSEAASNIASIDALQSRNFINYAATANQGDYLIVSNSALFNGANGSNPVDDYRAYRASAQGGGYNAKIYLEDQLADQFGFGIKKNPAGIRNFIRFARNKFTAAPKEVLIVGRGVHYLDQRSIDAGGSSTQKDNLAKLNLVPTFGWPASDMLLAAEPGTSSPATPIGRVTAITPAEVSVYLKKVKEYELAQQTLSPAVGDKAWMKNIAHIAGAGEEPLASTLINNLNAYKRIIEDTLYGAKVTTFAKTSTNLVQQLTDADLVNLVNEGLSLITYYGHSSATTLEFNLDDPANYSNKGKYPMFFALGCNAGNTFDYNENRFGQRNYLSDKYVLAPDGGSINFIASTSFGIVHYLDYWNLRAYTNICRPMYRSPIGDVMKKTIEEVFGLFSPDDFLARCNAEQTILNGDPGLRMNQQAKPDYTLVDTLIKVSPAIVTVADQTFSVNLKMLNLGKAISNKIVLETKRQVGSGPFVTLRRDTIAGIRYADSLSFSIPIDPLKDKGTNRLQFTIDADNQIDELFETNNTVTKEFIIFEDEARPVYPFNFSIINQPTVTLKASTANPFSATKQYRMEFDTTELFNSPVKVVQTLSSPGGTIEFNPGVTLASGTVYYWRISPDTSNGKYTWNTSSFLYLANSDFGYNQSHFFQHLKSMSSNMGLDSGSRRWVYYKQPHDLFIKNTVYPFGSVAEGDYVVSVDGAPYIRSACVGNSLIFNVFDPNTFIPWRNLDANGNNLYRFGSGSANCAPGRQNNFEFSYMTSQSRKLMMDFMDSIPVGAYVAVRSIDANPIGGLSSTWRSDTTLYGSNNSLYHKLLAAGFLGIDSLNARKSWAFVYQKGVSGYQPKYIVSKGLYDLITLSAETTTFGSSGTVSSPVFGPAKAWKELRWDGTSPDNGPGDAPVLSVIGIKNSGVMDTLVSNIGLNRKTVDLSFVNASQYPNLKLFMQNTDSAFHTPFQLDYWRITGSPAPEGAIAPGIFMQKKDTLDVAEPLDFRIAFKNLTATPFDSLKVKLIVTDKNNVQHLIPVNKQRPLAGNDTLHVYAPVDTKSLVGNNTLLIDVNPDNDQVEQYHFNNFAFVQFYVRPDTLKPLMDVTFDNVHILNHDIVAAKPDIMVKIKDESKWYMLTDTASVKVKVRFPDGSTRSYFFNNDTLHFTPAQPAPSSNNTATINLRPYFTQDGDYELIVSGKDMSQNNAGDVEYRVSFKVYNKPMISNMLNYPNPFTTSTAFVFTVTGVEVPQNLKIEIMTVTGKIVREITKAELGSLHIGRNITEFKWDGTDQFGQKLANGVYLYRVVTNENGKALEKYRDANDDTDKYFTKGYGKMYLMR
ncbi:C25 family cysteine peptidase [Flavisolibacter ginsenosidimutans]|uniref:Gingipain domain-containing protein n=1 Tax=Flavisolibacter ginsenosidimutans TaxID=661481 RepID=A0A5B8UPD4_9BACT|nr:C25 family cysteine peptidase [Flavisolibacter ginsenosidimutans]QEC58316.1 hypothetical protein FSB75_21200 [Flavisolibacter ginsenosidimutans]